MTTKMVAPHCRIHEKFMTACAECFEAQGYFSEGYQAGLEAACSQPVAPGPESAWLIERGRLCLGTCEYRLKWVTFTDPAALRFSRQSDAYAFMEVLKWEPFKLFEEMQGAMPAEHMWPNPALAAPPQVSAAPEFEADETPNGTTTFEFKTSAGELYLETGRTRFSAHFKPVSGETQYYEGKMAGAVSAPRCPVCREAVVFGLLSYDVQGIVANCVNGHRFPLYNGLADCAQFFQPDAQPSPEVKS